jgi:hypothetical protein
VRTPNLLSPERMNRIVIGPDISELLAIRRKSRHGFNSWIARETGDLWLRETTLLPVCDVQN